MSEKSTKSKTVVKKYPYPNVYFLLGVYAVLSLVAIALWPFETSWDKVLPVALVSLSILVVSLVAGPMDNPKTIEHTWLKNTAASSFITAFAAITIGTSLASAGLVDWKVMNFAVIAIIVIDVIAKLIIAKKKDS